MELDRLGSFTLRRGYAARRPYLEQRIVTFRLKDKNDVLSRIRACDVSQGLTPTVRELSSSTDSGQGRPSVIYPLPALGRPSLRPLAIPVVYPRQAESLRADLIEYSLNTDTGTTEGAVADVLIIDNHHHHAISATTTRMCCMCSSNSVQSIKA
jgi:hypothetical protein